MTGRYNEDSDIRRTSEAQIRQQYRDRNEAERINRLHKPAIGDRDNESTLRTAQYCPAIRNNFLDI